MCESLCGVGEMGEGVCVCVCVCVNGGQLDGVKFMVWSESSTAQRDADVTSTPRLLLPSSVLHKELKTGIFVCFFHFRGSDCQSSFIFCLVITWNSLYL